MSEELVLTGDENVPDMPMTDAQVNHLRRLLAWMRCEWMLDEDMQRGCMSAITGLSKAGVISHDQATAAVASRTDRINQVPAYVRQAVKMLTKAINQHDARSGVLESS